MRRILPAEAGGVSCCRGRFVWAAMAAIVSTVAPAQTQAQVQSAPDGPSRTLAPSVTAHRVAQWSPPPLVPTPRPLVAVPVPVQAAANARSIAEAAALSALMPGAGQYRLGQRRAWAYLAVEVAAWGFYVDRRRAGGAGRDRYRDFAWERGRIQGSSRVDGSFDYYETMSKWIRSGAFDVDAGAVGIQPETDPTAFNGSIWSLADQIYQPGPGAPPGDPRLEQALAYYQQRAYGTDFLWDWTGTGTARTEYADLISESDARFRQATNALGVVFANHIASAVDAFLSARGLASPVAASLRPWRDAPLGSWSAVLSVTTR